MYQGGGHNTGSIQLDSGCISADPAESADAVDVGYGQKRRVDNDSKGFAFTRKGRLQVSEDLGKAHFMHMKFGIYIRTPSGDVLGVEFRAEVLASHIECVSHQYSR